MNERFIKTVEILLNSLFMFLNSLSHILFHYVNIVVCLIILKCFQLFMNFLTLPAALLRNNCNQRNFRRHALLFSGDLILLFSKFKMCSCCFIFSFSSVCVEFLLFFSAAQLVVIMIIWKVIYLLSLSNIMLFVK